MGTERPSYCEHVPNSFHHESMEKSTLIHAYNEDWRLPPMGERHHRLVDTIVKIGGPGPKKLIKPISRLAAFSLGDMTAIACLSVKIRLSLPDTAKGYAVIEVRFWKKIYKELKAPWKY